MSTRAERKAIRNATRCRGCGALLARHYVPPSAGIAGFYLCATTPTTETRESAGESES